MSPDLPPAVSAILESQNLTWEHTIRQGPRYFVGSVQGGDGGNRLILKAVIANEPWRSAHTQATFRPSDQLQAEITTLALLGRHGGGICGRVPTLHASSAGDPVWSLRQVIGGQDMAANDSPFVFANRFYTMVEPAVLIDYVTSFQLVTPQLRAHLAGTPRTDRAGLEAKLVVAGLSNPQPRLQPYAAAVWAYLNERHQLHATAPQVLSHGEIYPPHLFIEDGQICLIDWENAGLDNPFHDLVAVWIRASGNAGWQAQYRAEIGRRGPQLASNWQQLWELETVYQAAGALNYLDWSRLETPDQQASAEAWLTALLAEALGGQRAL